MVSDLGQVTWTGTHPFQVNSTMMELSVNKHDAMYRKELPMQNTKLSSVNVTTLKSSGNNI